MDVAARWTDDIRLDNTTKLKIGRTNAEGLFSLRVLPSLKAKSRVSRRKFGSSCIDDTPPSNCWPMMFLARADQKDQRQPSAAHWSSGTCRRNKRPALPFEAAKQLSPIDPPRAIEPLVAESNSQNGGN
jgi:hypothetical protein